VLVSDKPVGDEPQNYNETIDFTDDISIIRPPILDHDQTTRDLRLKNSYLKTTNTTLEDELRNATTALKDLR